MRGAYGAIWGPYGGPYPLILIRIAGFMVRVRGSSNGLTNHPGGDVYRGLLMHAGLLLLFVVVVVVGGGTHPKMSPK